MFEDFLGVNPWTALFILLNTITIFLVGRKYLFGPVMKLIEERQQEIDGMYADAWKAKESAQTLQAEYAAKLNDAHATGDRIVKEAVARAQHREEEIIRQANADASAILSKANADIALEKKKALNEAKDEISGISMAIAEKVVERQLNDQDQQTLIRQFIDNLGDAL